MSEDKLPELSFNWVDVDTRCCTSEDVIATLIDGSKVNGYFQRIEKYGEKTRICFVVNEEEDEGDEIELNEILDYV